VSKLYERLTRRVEQEGQQRSFVREDEGIEGVGHGKHQVEIGHRQQRGLGAALLQRRRAYYESTDYSVKYLKKDLSGSR